MRQSPHRNSKQSIRKFCRPTRSAKAAFRYAQPVNPKVGPTEGKQLLLQPGKRRSRPTSKAQRRTTFYFSPSKQRVCGIDRSTDVSALDRLPHCQGLFRQTVCGLQAQVPPGNIMPGSGLVTDLFVYPDQGEAESLVKPDAGRIGECDTSVCPEVTLNSQELKKHRIKRRSDSLAAVIL